MPSGKKVLVTGGLGFIGSHTVVELLQAGYETVIVDDLSNSELFILDRIEQITGKRPGFYQLNLSENDAAAQIFRQEKSINVIIHFAASKSVGESMVAPLKYFRNNLYSLINILEVSGKIGCQNFVFSSSAKVYGQPDDFPVSEISGFKKSVSAYGSTKQMNEEILEKVSVETGIKTISLRYFNAVGAHPTSLIGELPIGIPNNLMPYICHAAIGELKELIVYGKDYNTPDGTAIRDYIHVVDLAKAHVKACEFLLDKRSGESFEVFNIGTGKGNSVLELIKTFEQINKIKVPYKIGVRRAGDVVRNYADCTKANSILGWQAKLNLKDMVRDAWNWQKAIRQQT